jgi:predicted amidohydrolase YtcJ
MAGGSMPATPVHNIRNDANQFQHRPLLIFSTAMKPFTVHFCLLTLSRHRPARQFRAYCRAAYGTALAYGLLFGGTSCGPPQSSQTPDSGNATLIITNARIITMDTQHPSAQALAIHGEKVMALGTRQEMEPYTGPATRIIDAGGRTLIPGLNDSHLHVIRGGRFYNTELRWDGVKSLRQGLQMIREQAARTPEGQWVKVVGGWSEQQFAEKRMPTLAEIREVAPQRPVFVLYLYGEAFMNEAALKAAGIDQNTPDPPGGIIERDESGTPTGRLVAAPNAYILYSNIAKAPMLSLDEQRNSTRQFVRELNRFGITSVVDPGGGFQNFPEDYAIADTLASRGELNLRIPFYLFAQKAGSEYEDYLRWVSQARDQNSLAAAAHHQYFLDGGGENLVMAAADFENFRQQRPVLDKAMEAQLKRVVNLLVENRWPFRLHATYDESISRFLNVLEDINRQRPFNGLRWYFDHAETISEANLQRVKALGGGIAIQNRMSYQGESFIERYGEQAAAAAPPVKRMLELGIPVGLGTDGTRVSSYNPWMALYWLVSGRTAGGTEMYPPGQRLDRLTALGLMTTGSARLTGEDTVKGMIRPGYYADLALLSDDYLETDESRIPAIESLLTIVNGKVVYGREAFSELAPPPLEVLPAWSPAAHFNGYGGRPKE